MINFYFFFSGERSDDPDAINYIPTLFAFKEPEYATIRTKRMEKRQRCDEEEATAADPLNVDLGKGTPPKNNTLPNACDVFAKL